MTPQELERYIGQPIRYVIPPHFGWRHHSQGRGVLDLHPQGHWQILMPEEGGAEFLLSDSMLEQIEYDRQEQMLSFVYIP